MDSYRYPAAPAQKLKFSCDPCSASKLRCGKQKPVCARCAALNQPCSYSPARRSGRPHRVRQQVKSQNQDQNQNQNQQVGDDRSSNMIDNRKMIESDAWSLFEFGGENPARPMGLPQHNGGQEHHQQSHSYTHTHQQQQQQQQEYHHIFNNDLELPGPTDCTKTALLTLQQLDKSLMSSDSSCMYSSLTIVESCQRLLKILICPCSERPGVALLVASGCVSLMDAVSQGHHCRLTQDMEIPNLSSSTSTTTATTPSTDMDWFQIMPASVVGLLQPLPQHDACQDKNSNVAQNGSSNNNSNNVDRRSRSSSGSYSATNSSVSRLDDFAKIAKVISQFADRYQHQHQQPQAGTGLARTIQLMAPMVTFLRARLQSTMHEATRSIVL